MLVAVLAAAAIVLIGFAVSQFMYINDMQEVYRAQSAELATNPSVFAITAPEDQAPQDTFVMKWSDGGSRHFVLRAKTNESFTLSDPDQPTAVVGRTTGVVTPCSKLNVKEYGAPRRPFVYGGKKYNLVLTYQGNAAVCKVA